MLVSNVVNRYGWKEAVRVLEDFWRNQQYGLSSTPDISKWLNDAEKQKILMLLKRLKKILFSKSMKIRELQMYVRIQNQKMIPNSRIHIIHGHLHDINPLQHTIERYSKMKNTEKLRIATSGTTESQVYLSLVLM